MKIVKTASGKQTIKLSKKEWTNIGKKAGWIKTAQMATNNAPSDSGDFVESWNETSKFLAVLQNRIEEGKRMIDSSTTKEEVDEVIELIEAIGDRINTWTMSAKIGL